METEKPKHKWSGLGYEQVPGLANRIIARYLRGQRKNMERFFQEHGLYDSAERMRQIRLSRQGMMAKNRMFQEVLSEYAAKSAANSGVVTDDQRPAPQPAPEAAPVEGGGSVALPDGAADVHVGESGAADGPRADAGTGVPVVAPEVDNGNAGLVIEE